LLRGTDQWTPNAGSGESWGGGAALSLGPPSSGMFTVAAPGAVMPRLVPERAGAGPGGIPGIWQHRQGWKRLSSPTSGGSEPQRACYRFDSSPCSVLKLDEEMTMFESLITRTVSDRFFNLSARTSSLSQEIAAEISSVVKEGTHVVAEAGEKLKSSEVDGLKRKRSGLPEMAVQVGGIQVEAAMSFFHRVSDSGSVQLRFELENRRKFKLGLTAGCDNCSCYCRVIVDGCTL